jgi:endonuclease YncB( thermonuclease family)
VAHSGGLDANGGHRDSSGSYHYHRPTQVEQATTATTHQDNRGSHVTKKWGSDALAGARTAPKTTYRKSARAEAPVNRASQRPPPIRYLFHDRERPPFEVSEFENNGEQWRVSLVTGVHLNLLKSRIVRIECILDPRDYRTWYDASGRYSIVGKFDGYQENQVALLTIDGRRVRVESRTLSEIDWKFVLNKFFDARSMEVVRVVGVSDGDTVTLLTAENKQIRCRLFGIDSPESGQPYGTRARQYLSSLVFGKEVVFRTMTTDRFGRTIGRLTINEADVSIAMVQAGLAWHYAQFSDNDPVLAASQELSKSHGNGLWNDPNPTPPWEFRRPK